MALTYSPTNSKTRRLAEYFPGEDLTEPMAMAGFSLPAGWSCPHADICKSKSDRVTGKIFDAPQVEFRCWAASLEARLPNIRSNYWNNFDQLKACATVGQMVDLLLEPLPMATRIVRIHVHGDFFN